MTIMSREGTEPPSLRFAEGREHDSASRSALSFGEPRVAASGNTPTVRVVSLQAPGLLVVEERPTSPLSPAHTRVTMKAAGVCSSDIPRSHGGAYGYPLVLGHELAGVVSEVGQGAEGPAKGTLVTVFPLLPCFSCTSCRGEEYARCSDYDYLGSRRDGGFATFVDAPHWNLLPVPPGVSARDAALTEPLAVVVHALDRLGLMPRSPTPKGLAILGCGFLGLLAMAVLRKTHPNLHVTVLGRHPGKLARAEALGARVVLEAHHEELLATESFPRVLEAAGAPATFANSLALACPGGRVVWMGNPSGDVTLPQALASQVLRKELTVCGTWNSRYRGREPSDWTIALDLMAGGVRPSAFVTAAVGLEGTPRLLKRLHALKEGGGPSELKALITMDSSV